MAEKADASESIVSPRRLVRGAVAGGGAGCRAAKGPDTPRRTPHHRTGHRTGADAGTRHLASGLAACGPRDNAQWARIASTRHTSRHDVDR